MSSNWILKAEADETRHWCPSCATKHRWGKCPNYVPLPSIAYELTSSGFLVTYGDERIFPVAEIPMSVDEPISPPLPGFGDWEPADTHIEHRKPDGTEMSESEQRND